MRGLDGTDKRRDDVYEISLRLEPREKDEERMCVTMNSARLQLIFDDGLKQNSDVTRPGKLRATLHRGLASYRDLLTSD